MVYDEAGNVLKSTEYAGNVTTYTYDDFDRVIAKAVGGDTIRYAYTVDGMLSSVTDKNGTISYNYDVMNGLTSVTLYDGKTIDYTYDEACRLTSVETCLGRRSMSTTLWTESCALWLTTGQPRSTNMTRTATEQPCAMPTDLS